ncbi:MAG: hypothetical protein V4675_03775 [Verrucomicrobiota bacterium]
MGACVDEPKLWFGKVVALIPGNAKSTAAHSIAGNLHHLRRSRPCAVGAEGFGTVPARKNPPSRIKTFNLNQLNIMNSNLPPPTGSEETEPLQTVKAEAEKVKTAVKEQAEQTAVKIKDEAEAASGHLKDAGKRFAESQKTALAEKAGELAGAVTALSEKLQQAEEPNLLAGPAQSFAQELTTLAQFLKRSNPEQILHGVENLARRKPELVYGGLFLTGLLAARFLKASGSRAAEKLREDRRKNLPRNDAGSTRSGATYFNPSNV